MDLKCYSFCKKKVCLFSRRMFPSIREAFAPQGRKTF